jgi:hypothetical protein
MPTQRVLHLLTQPNALFSSSYGSNGQRPSRDRLQMPWQGRTSSTHIYNVKVYCPWGQEFQLEGAVDGIESTSTSVGIDIDPNAKPEGSWLRESFRMGKDSSVVKKGGDE